MKRSTGLSLVVHYRFWKGRQKKLSVHGFKPTKRAVPKLRVSVKNPGAGSCLPAHIFTFQSNRRQWPGFILVSGFFELETRIGLGKLLPKNVLCRLPHTQDTSHRRRSLVAPKFSWYWFSFWYANFDHSTNSTNGGFPPFDNLVKLVHKLHIILRLIPIIGSTSLR